MGNGTPKNTAKVAASGRLLLPTILLFMHSGGGPFVTMGEKDSLPCSPKLRVCGRYAFYPVFLSLIPFPSVVGAEMERSQKNKRAI